MPLPLPVEREHELCPVSADAWVETDVLVEQVHLQDVRDSRRFLVMLMWSLADERERYTAALARHDLAGADESAAEQRDLVALASVLSDHLRSVRA